MGRDQANRAKLFPEEHRKFLQSVLGCFMVWLTPLRRICRRWEIRTLDLIIFISAVCSVGWQNEQIPLWGVRGAFYN